MTLRGEETLRQRLVQDKAGFCVCVCLCYRENDRGHGVFINVDIRIQEYLYMLIHKSTTSYIHTYTHTQKVIRMPSPPPDTKAALELCRPTSVYCSLNLLAIEMYILHMMRY